MGTYVVLVQGLQVPTTHGVNAAPYPGRGGNTGSARQTGCRAPRTPSTAARRPSLAQIGGLALADAQVLNIVVPVAPVPNRISNLPCEIKSNQIKSAERRKISNQRSRRRTASTRRRPAGAVSARGRERGGRGGG